MARRHSRSCSALEGPAQRFLVVRNGMAWSARTTATTASAPPAFAAPRSPSLARSSLHDMAALRVAALAAALGAAAAQGSPTPSPTPTPTPSHSPGPLITEFSVNYFSQRVDPQTYSSCSGTHGNFGIYASQNDYDYKSAIPAQQTMAPALGWSCGFESFIGSAPIWSATNA